MIEKAHVELELARYRVTYDPLASGASAYIVKERQDDGTWKTLQRVKRFACSIDTEGIPVVYLDLLDV